VSGRKPAQKHRADQHHVSGEQWEGGQEAHFVHEIQSREGHRKPVLEAVKIPPFESAGKR
jgi:hypothetical protein